jgi:hypothetical protein
MMDMETMGPMLGWMMGLGMLGWAPGLSATNKSMAFAAAGDPPPGSAGVG